MDSIKRCYICHEDDSSEENNLILSPCCNCSLYVHQKCFDEHILHEAKKNMATVLRIPYPERLAFHNNVNESNHESNSDSCSDNESNNESNSDSCSDNESNNDSNSDSCSDNESINDSNPDEQQPLQNIENNIYTPECYLIYMSCTICRKRFEYYSKNVVQKLLLQKILVQQFAQSINWEATDISNVIHTENQTEVNLDSENTSLLENPNHTNIQAELQQLSPSLPRDTLLILQNIFQQLPPPLVSRVLHVISNIIITVGSQPTHSLINEINKAIKSARYIALGIFTGSSVLFLTAIRAGISYIYR